MLSCQASRARVPALVKRGVGQKTWKAHVSPDLFSAVSALLPFRFTSLPQPVCHPTKATCTCLRFWSESLSRPDIDSPLMLLSCKLPFISDKRLATLAISSYLNPRPKRKPPVLVLCCMTPRLSSLKSFTTLSPVIKIVYQKVHADPGTRLSVEIEPLFEITTTSLDQLYKPHCSI